jgi:hypothetical protein
MNPDQLLPLIDGATTVTLLSLAIVAWLRGWIVSGREFEGMRRDRDRWRDMTLRSAGLAERGTRAATRAAEELEELT